MDAVGAELLTKLLDEHGDALVLFARQWCSNPEDVVQEAFVSLAGERPTPTNLAGWLYRVVRNGAISAARSANRRVRHETAAAKRDDAFFETSRSAQVDADDATAALRELPLELRETIVARLWGELSFEEIAALTGTTKSTAHRRYVAGLSAMRMSLDKNNGTASHPKHELQQDISR